MADETKSWPCENLQPTPNFPPENCRPASKKAFPRVRKIARNSIELGQGLPIRAESDTRGSTTGARTGHHRSDFDADGNDDLVEHSRRHIGVKTDIAAVRSIKVDRGEFDAIDVEIDVRRDGVEIGDDPRRGSNQLGERGVEIARFATHENQILRLAVAFFDRLAVVGD